MKISFPGRRSDDVIDQRGRSAGGMTGLPLGALAGLGLPGIAIVVVLMLLGGGNILGGGGGGFGVDAPFDTAPAPGVAPDSVPGAPDPEAAMVEFVSFVLDDVQVSWDEAFARDGQDYEEAKLVLFTDGVQSGCGFASSATGPFYCPADQRVYLDLGFFQELASRFQAPGDFAQAYVIAHEIAHHVQNLTGISDEVHRLQREQPDDANELSIRLELQADCLAGVWGYTTYQRGILEDGDVEEGLAAAAAVGDDRIQRQSGGSVNQETWTHGSSEQRVSWFRRGFESGDASECNTFE